MSSAMVLVVPLAILVAVPRHAGIKAAITGLNNILARRWKTNMVATAEGAPAPHNAITPVTPGAATTGSNTITDASSWRLNMAAIALAVPATASMQAP